MKKLLKVVITVLCLVAIFSMAKITVRANEESVENTEVRSIIVKETEETQETQETQEYETFTYRLIVDRLDYLSYCKGHDGDYTLIYSVNGGEEQTVLMGKCGFELFNNKPTIICHYYDIQNVKVGDVIDYTYSFYNTYFQDKEPSVVKGSKVVDGPFVPEENK